MGGGRRQVKEVPKKLEVTYHAHSRLQGEPGAHGAVLDTPICEREHVITCRLEEDVEVGDDVRVVLGDPLALMAGSRFVGRVSDAPLAATLTACLEAEYTLVGRVQTVDLNGREVSAIVVGVRP